MFTYVCQNSALVTILFINFWGGMMGVFPEVLLGQEIPFTSITLDSESSKNSEHLETGTETEATDLEPHIETVVEIDQVRSQADEPLEIEAGTEPAAEPVAESETESEAEEPIGTNTATPSTRSSPNTATTSGEDSSVEPSENVSNDRPGDVTEEPRSKPESDASNGINTPESEASVPQPITPETPDPSASAVSRSLALALRYACLTIPSPQLYAYPRPSLEHSPLGDRIRAFTVTVWGETSWGTGVIVQQQPTAEGWDYLVLTNSHVIRDDRVNIQTSDRQVHSTMIALDDRSGGYDLAVLRFSSSQPYTVARIQTEVRLNEPTIAVGFPFDRADLETPERSEFQWTEGEIVHILDEPLVDGYQFAYSNAIEKGMSGGPVLNLRGELIAMNGLHAHPLWGNPFVYPNGRLIDPALATLAEESSWSIPIATIRERSAEFWVNQVVSPIEQTVILRDYGAAEIGMNP